jgi:phage tail tape-measure protein
VNIIEGNLGKFGATAGAGLGTAIAGPGLGTAAGGYIGNKLGVAGQEALAKKALTKEALNTQKQMEKNAQMGSNKLKDIKK